VPRVIAVLGPGADAQAFGPVPLGVELHEELPASAALPHVDYVVTHGGAATLTALQLHGKPSLLLPQGADQPINASAARTRGISVVRFHTAAAVVVGAWAREPLTTDSIEQAFRELTTDPGYRRRAEEFRMSLNSLPPLEYAVELLERLAATRSPVMRTPEARERLERRERFAI
jgi:UDP:flavonoid glycosyltransferase YjiC (YdhE family)